MWTTFSFSLINTVLKATQTSAECCSVVLLTPLWRCSPALSRQDDSDEEPSTATQTPEHDDLMEFVSLSCEEGEETTSSEVSPPLPPVRFIVCGPCLKTSYPVQDNEMEGSDSNDEEWKSDSSRLVLLFLSCFCSA